MTQNIKWSHSIYSSMDNLPVFANSDEFRTWKALVGKPSKKKLDAIASRILAAEGSIHPAILTALMDAMMTEYGSIAVTTVMNIASKARPQDCSPDIKATEILVSEEEIVAAAEILSANSSKDRFHRYLAEAELYHGEGDRVNSVDSAHKGLDLDPSCRALYDILIADDPDGPWVDLLSVQNASERREDRTPKDERLNELYQIYVDWFKGNKDAATDRLIKSQYYAKGDW